MKWLAQFKDYLDVFVVLAGLGALPLVRWGVRRYRTWRATWMMPGEVAVALARVTTTLEAFGKQLAPNGGLSIAEKIDRIDVRTLASADDARMARVMTRQMADSDRRAALIEMDGRGSVVYTNEAWRRITGLSVQETLAWGWLNGVDQDDRGPLEEEWESAMEQRRVMLMRTRLRNVVGGGVTHVRIRLEPVLSETGRPLGWVGSATVFTPEGDG